MNEPEKRVVVATFDNPVIANIVRSRLESENIPAFLEDEHYVALDWGASIAVGGIKLTVSEQNEQNALSILKTRPDTLPTPPDSC